MGSLKPLLIIKLKNMLDLNAAQLNKLAAMPTKHSWMAQWFALEGWQQSRVENNLANWVEIKRRELPSGFLALRMAAYLLEYEALQMLREQDYRLMYRIPEVNDIEEAIDLAKADNHLMSEKEEADLRLSLDNLVNKGLRPKPEVLDWETQDEKEMWTRAEVEQEYEAGRMSKERRDWLMLNLPEQK